MYDQLHGLAETNFFPFIIPNPEDWGYHEFDQRMGQEFRLIGQGLYELNIHRDSDLDLFQGIFSTFFELQE